jgi:hypothetical protein
MKTLEWQTFVAELDAKGLPAPPYQVDPGTMRYRAS